MPGSSRSGFDDVTRLVTNDGINTFGRKLLFNPDTKHFRMEVPDGVQIVGFTPDGKVVAITETKPSGETYCHLPSGMAEIGETLIEAAARELKEETGYTFKELSPIASANQAPLHLFGVDVTYVAFGCVKDQAITLKPDTTEKITKVEELAPDELERRLCAHLTKTPLEEVSGRNSLASLRLALYLVNRDGLLNPPVTEKSPLLVIIAGLPLSGKTTLGDAIKEQLNIHYCDIDRLREHVTGLLTKEENDRMWDTDPDAGKKQERTMRIAYQALHDGAVNAMLEMRRSFAVSATYSRVSSQKFLKALADRHGARVKIILCTIKDATKEEIERRMAREAGRQYVSGCNNWNDYLDISSRYQSVLTSGVFPKECILEVDTSKPLETYLPQAVNFIQN